MQGFGMMLKMMGIDPEQLQIQAERMSAIVDDIQSRFIAIEKDIAEIKQILVKLDPDYVPADTLKLVEDKIDVGNE